MSYLSRFARRRGCVAAGPEADGRGQLAYEGGVVLALRAAAEEAHRLGAEGIEQRACAAMTLARRSRSAIASIAWRVSAMGNSRCTRPSSKRRRASRSRSSRMTRSDRAGGPAEQTDGRVPTPAFRMGELVRCDDLAHPHASWPRTRSASTKLFEQPRSLGSPPMPPNAGWPRRTGSRSKK